MAGRIQEEPTMLVATPLLTRMLQAAHNQGKGDPLLLSKSIIFGIDPGETTGLCWWLPYEPTHFYVAQLETKQVGPALIKILGCQPVKGQDFNLLRICEDYKVYSWKATDHSWNGLHTSKLIGAIEADSYFSSIPLVYQMAGQAKAWATDEKLKLWGLYEPGLRHGRDATRHLINFMFFGKSPTKLVTEAEMRPAHWNF